MEKIKQFFIITRMLDASEKLDFERAKEYRDLIQHIHNLTKTKIMSLPKNLDKDIIHSVVDTKIVQPARGTKKEMVDLANHNAEVALENKFQLIAKDESRTVKAIEELGERMGIQTPIRIEAFDNSNIQGVDPVSAMVTFVDGKPDKKDIVNTKLRL